MEAGTPAAHRQFELADGFDTFFGQAVGSLVGGNAFLRGRIYARRNAVSDLQADPTSASCRVLIRSDEPPAHGVRIFSQQTAREILSMLEMAVQPEGTAPKARVPGYRVGGKTGTAYKVEGGAYVRKYVASFVGLAPISDPRLVVAVMIDEPSGGAHYGGDVAGPVFSQIMGGALRTLGIQPDAPILTAEASGGKGRL